MLGSLQTSEFRNTDFRLLFYGSLKTSEHYLVTSDACGLILAPAKIKYKAKLKTSKERYQKRVKNSK